MSDLVIGGLALLALIGLVGMFMDHPNPPY